MKPIPSEVKYRCENKIVGRVDLELESRGSIFSGRDEKSILVYKRNLEQQKMREELLKQIEEKKKREEDHKRKLKEEEMKEEFRINRELNQINSDNQPAFSSSNIARGKAYQNQTSYENSLANSAYLPELSNRKSESIVEAPINTNQNETVKDLQNTSNKFETTAGFAISNQSPKKVDDEAVVSIVNQNSISNVKISESNKIKDMINQ